MHTKDDNTIRIYFQNIKGIKLTQSWDKWRDIVTEIKSRKVDIAGLVETNINWNPIRELTAKSILRKVYWNGQMINASSDDPIPSAYKQGGSSMLVLNKPIGSIATTGIDHRGLGRWSYVILNGRNNVNIVIITAYRVCQDTGTNGDLTAFQQQYRLLRRQNIIHPHPKKVFDQDLIFQLKEWTNKKYEIILMIDANSSLTHPQLQNIINHSQLYDLLGATHGIDSPNTYIRGNKTIDFLFGTKGVKHSMTQCGMLSFNDGVLSDHRALWMDLKHTNLIHSELTSPNNKPTNMSSKNAHWVKRAKDVISKHIACHHVRANLNKLQNTPITSSNSHCLAKTLDKIDQDIHEAMLQGAKLANNTVLGGGHLH